MVLEYSRIVILNDKDQWCGTECKSQQIKTEHNNNNMSEYCEGECAAQWDMCRRM